MKEFDKRIRRISTLVVIGMFIAMIFGSASVYAAWDENGDDLVMGYTGADSEGNVGIGTYTPETKLHVISDNEAHIRVQMDGYDPYMDIISGGHWCGLDIHDSNVHLFTIWEDGWDVGEARFHIKRGGNVGIGTMNPNYKLEIEDTDLSSGEHLRPRGHRRSARLSAAAVQQLRQHS